MKNTKQLENQSAKLLVLLPLIYICLPALSWSRLDLAGALAVPWAQQTLGSALPAPGHSDWSVPLSQASLTDGIGAPPGGLWFN